MSRFAIPLLLLILLSCSREPEEEAGTVTIEFWTIALGDAFADYILGMIETYEQAHPGVKVKWVDVSGGEVAEKFLAALVGDTPPDLANIYDLPRFLQYDILVNMDEAVSAAEKAKRLENFWHGVGYYQGANGIQVAVAIAGTLNDEADIDSLWTTEIAIPFAAFAGYAPQLPPQLGDVWRLNLYRTGGKINLQYITWSDTQKPKPQFHAPGRFGFAHFLDQRATPAGD